MNDIEIYEKIISELNNFNFTRRSLSYQYLIEAIYIVATDQKKIRDFKRFVYSDIAKKYDTGIQNVQWCIEKLLKLMYLNTDEKIIREYFEVGENERLSAKAFIIFIAQKSNKGAFIKKYTQIGS